MGSVYLGEDPTGRRVAVKVIRADLLVDPGFRARFRSEVKRARQVPAFCTAEVLDADPDHATPYLVIEYVDGPGLNEIIEDRGPLAGGSLHSLAIGVAVALAAIHDAGVVHRDLKPSNVLVSVGTPKVIDFGIAKSLDTTEEHTATGQIVGTLAYMAPERFNPLTTRSTGTAADIFAWGAVVLFAATGRAPFGADTFPDAAGNVGRHRPDLTALSEPLRGLVAEALRVDPTERPTAQQLLDRLINEGAAGNAAIERGLRERPQLSRAAAAVMHTRPEPTAPSPDTGGLDELPTFHGRRAVPIAVGAAVLVAVCVFVGLGHVDPGARDRSGTRPPGSAATAVETRQTGDRAGRGNGRRECGLAGPLRVTLDNPRPFSCSVTAGVQASTTITFGFTLDSDAACVAVWTSVGVDDETARVTFCSAQLSMDLESSRSTRTVAFTDVSPALAFGRWHQASLTVAGSTFTAGIDGHQHLTKTIELAARPGGDITLGLAAGAPSATGATAISLGGIEVASGP